MIIVNNSLAIILGASGWPLYPGFETSPTFQNSANFFRDYFLREESLGLPADNLLWLFDDEGLPASIVQKIGEFLRKRATPEIRNIFLYYIGHGGYLDKEYFVALRCTDQNNRDLTVLPIKYIAKKLYEETPDKRHIIIIDACYASGAVKEFIYQDAAATLADVRQQIREVLPETDIDKGSALFCAAGPKTKAKAPWEGEYTMFSGALQRVLSTGDPTFDDYLSLEEVAGLVDKDIFNTFRAEAVRPELHTPKQEKGDIRSLRLFPNPARRKELEGRSIRELRVIVDELVRAVGSLGKEIKEIRDSIAVGQAQRDNIHVRLDKDNSVLIDTNRTRDPIIQTIKWFKQLGAIPSTDLVLFLIYPLSWLMFPIEARFIDQVLGNVYQIGPIVIAIYIFVRNTPFIFIPMMRLQGQNVDGVLIFLFGKAVEWWISYNILASIGWILLLSSLGLL